MKPHVIVAITGASGVIYGVRLLKTLLEHDTHVSLVVSGAGKEVLRHEMGFSGISITDDLQTTIVSQTLMENLSIYEEHDFFAPFASGSFRHDGMVIAPCTMGTLSAVANGSAGNLIHRAADVCLKERYPLILLPRETPFNLIHIENMRRAAMAGATLMPPSPSFYSKPETIDQLVDTIVSRVLDHLGVSHSLVPPWGSHHESR